MSSPLSILLVLVPLALANPHHIHRYALLAHYTGANFLPAFEHQAIPDPTHGRVDYLSEQDALARGLTVPSPLNDGLILRSDAENMLDPHGPGRASVRLRSRREYTTHVVVLDVRHAPVGCGTWPAFWETREYGWPEAGEVDIIEGVNSIGPNHAALHTTRGCEMPERRVMTGTSTSTNCDWTVNYNQGCGVQFPSAAPSFGPTFNAQGGGVYAMERTEKHIRIWFWSREEVRRGAIPQDLARLSLEGVGVEGPSYGVGTDDDEGRDRIDTDTWGTPVALFPNTRCDLKRKFGPNSIIINLTFCGDWAGNDDVYRSADCPGSCVDFVNTQPRAFTDAYWDFKSLRVYEPLPPREQSVRIASGQGVSLNVGQSVFGKAAGGVGENGTSASVGFKSALKGMLGRIGGK